MIHRNIKRLNEVSKNDSVWSKHKANGDRLAAHYLGSNFHQYQDRIKRCGDILEFENTAAGLKLVNARFCRVRHCPICQWRRSLRWKARAYQAIPAVVQDFPKARWLFLTLTVKNCPIEELRETLTQMHEAYKRLTKLKAWDVVKGWIKSTEVTRGQDGSAHPHFHCLLMVSSSYFAGKKYLSQKRWAELWQRSLRVDYSPIIDIRAIKPTSNPAVLVPEILKYQTKEDDLISDRDWLLMLTEQLHKSRSIAVGGVLCNYMRQGKDFSEECQDELQEIDVSKEVLLRFSWENSKKTYNLILKQ